MPTNQVAEAVMLMAGAGSRLRGIDDSILKPLIPVGGRPLICYALDAVQRAGIGTIHIVVGYESEKLSAAMVKLVGADVDLRFVRNPEWQKQNGISLLAAAHVVAAPFFLTMSDHLFDQAIVDLMLSASAFHELNVAVDRKLNSIFDLADAMKVHLENDRVVEIGKHLEDYNAIDAGLFVCPPEIFAYLENAKRDGDVSLADGVRAMARDGKVRGIDIGEAWWQDVDTPEMLAQAEKHLRSRPVLVGPANPAE